jgi:hypothetical protein
VIVMSHIQTDFEFMKGDIIYWRAIC